MSDEFHEINSEAYFSSMLADSSALPLVENCELLVFNCQLSDRTDPRIIIKLTSKTSQEQKFADARERTLFRGQCRYFWHLIQRQLGSLY